MANLVEIVLQARDQATPVLRKFTAELAGVEAASARLAALRTPLAAVAAVMVTVGGAALVMARNIATSVEQLNRMATQSGVNIEDLQVIQEVIKRSGGNAEGLTRSLSFLNRAIAQQNPLLRQLGLEGKPVMEVFLGLARAFESSEDTGKKNVIAFKLLGRGGVELIADLSEMARHFDEVRDLMARTGGIITTEAAPAIVDLDRKLDDLGTVWEATMKRIQMTTIPAANVVLDFLARMLEMLPKVGPGMALLLSLAGAGKAGPEPGLIGPPMPAGFKPARGRDLLKGVRIGEPTGESLPEMLRQAAIISPGDFLPQLRGRARPAVGMGAEPPQPTARGGPLQEALTDWQQTMREMVSIGNTTHEALGAVWSGLAQGFGQVFAGLLQKGQTFKSALSTIFRALVSEILSMLAQLVAAQVFRLFLRLLGIAQPGGGGAAATAASFIPLGPGGAQRPASRPEAFGTRSTIIYNINAIDARDVVGELLSPAGAFRRAGERIQFQGNY